MKGLLGISDSKKLSYIEVVEIPLLCMMWMGKSLGDCLNALTVIVWSEASAHPIWDNPIESTDQVGISGRISRCFICTYQKDIKKNKTKKNTLNSRFYKPKGANRRSSQFGFTYILMLQKAFGISLYFVQSSVNLVQENILDPFVE